MVRLLRLFFCAGWIGSLVSCAAPPAAVPSPEWSFQREGIHLRLAGDQRLNLFRKTPHALVSCLYQLRDPNAFNQAVGEPGGVSKLLECGRFDPSVASAKRVVVQPKQELDQLLDRAEGARYLGYVAGYYRTRAAADSSTHLLAIPVVEEERGHLLWRSRTVHPAVVMLDLHLGAEGIVVAGGRR